MMTRVNISMGVGHVQYICVAAGFFGKQQMNCVAAHEKKGYACPDSVLLALLVSMLYSCYSCYSDLCPST